jgi:hypothetical protein
MKHWKTWIAFGAALGFGAMSQLACSSSQSGQQQEDAGSFRLALSGVSTGGVEYSLRNAVLRIYGPVNRTIQSEDYLGATEIAVELPAGEYLLRLDGNWTLEAPGGAAVNAALRSQNPLPFTIQDQVVTGLQIRPRQMMTLTEMANVIPLLAGWTKLFLTGPIPNYLKK